MYICNTKLSMTLSCIRAIVWLFGVLKWSPCNIFIIRRSSTLNFFNAECEWAFLWCSFWSTEILDNVVHKQAILLQHQRYWCLKESTEKPIPTLVTDWQISQQVQNINLLKVRMQKCLDDLFLRNHSSMLVQGIIHSVHLCLIYRMP